MCEAGGVRLRRTRRGWEEVAPARCPACGQRWGGHQVLVGVAHCRCGIHRSWSCRRCDTSTYHPPLAPDCVIQELDGRPG